MSNTHIPPHYSPTEDSFQDNLEMQAAANRAKTIMADNEPTTLVEKKKLGSRAGRVAVLTAGALAVTAAASGLVYVADKASDTFDELSDPHSNENMQVLDSTTVTSSLEDGSLIAGVQEGVSSLLEENDLSEGTIALVDIINKSNLAASEYQEIYNQPVQAGTRFTVELLKSNDDSSYEIDVLLDQ